MSIIQGNAKQGSTRGFYPKIINGSLRFNDDDSAYLSWTPASAGNRKTWTISFWMKRSELGGGGRIFDSGVNADNWTSITFNGNDTLQAEHRVSDVTQFKVVTSAVLRDPSAWYHIVVHFDTTQVTASNRLKLYINGTEASYSATTYGSQNTDTYVNSTNRHYLGAFNTVSQFFDGYLANVYFIDGQAKTASDFGETKNGVWVAKDYAGTYGTNGFYLTFEDDTQVEAFNTVLYSGASAQQSVTGIGFSPDLVWIKGRNNADWHNLEDSVRRDKRLYSNATNAEETGGIVSFDSDGFTLSSAGQGTNNQTGHNYVAWAWDAGANNAVTGHSSVTYTGSGSTMRVSGFPFSPDLVWYKNRGGAYSHRIYDTVRGAAQRLITNSTGAETANVTNELISFDKDGFVLAGGDTATNTSGQTYVAWGWDAGDSDPVSNTAGSITSTVKASTTNGFSIVGYTGTGANATVGHGLSSAPNFIILKDRDNVRNWGGYHSSLNGGTNPEQYNLGINSNGATQGPNAAYWNNTAPTTSVFSLGTGTTPNASGANYIAYCWHDVTGKQKFGTYTGDGGTSNSVTTGFRPGFVMIKRTDGAANWEIYDSSRGSFTTSGQLYPNTSDVEGANTIQFDSNGFTLTANRTNTNENTATYIYAAFAGSYSDYITDYNTNGSIDSRVKASDTTGFSIVSYVGTGAAGTVGHGLSSTPDMIIWKNRTSSTTGWPVYHSGMSGVTYWMSLNNTNGESVDDMITAIGSSTFTLGTDNWNNQSGNDIIAYCWTATTGVSAFGSYTANNSTNGPEVDCGFKPAFVMVKHTTKAEQWIIFDATRETTNDRSARLFPAISNAESSIPNDQGIRFLSTAEGDSISGFKITVAGGYGINDNDVGDQYIYAAFADTRDAAFWLDQSGNDNDWQPVNLDHNDTVADSPTDNFCTMNPLDKGSTITLSDGNLRISSDAGSDDSVRGTMALGDAQYYFEFTLESFGGGVQPFHWGIAKSNASLTTWPSGGDYVVMEDSGALKVDGGSVSYYSGGFAAGDVIGVAVDVPNDSITFYKNGTSLGAYSYTIEAGEYMPYVGDGSGTRYGVTVANFGQQPFKYDPPA